MRTGLHEGRVFQGFVLGLAVGAVLALFYLPRLNVQRLAQRTTSALNRDPVEEGLAEGREVAQQRLDEMRQRLSSTPLTILPRKSGS
jgi:hypothetical protein